MIYSFLRKSTVLLMELNFLNDIIISRADAILCPLFEGCDPILCLLWESNVADQRVTLSDVERNIRQRQLFGAQVVDVFGLQLGDDGEPESQFADLNYELWNRGEFPGVEDAMSQVRADEDGILRPTEDGLDERWVRRRLGAVPDSGTEAVRPFYAEDVAGAEGRWTDEDVAPEYDAFGVDIARGGGDRTVVVGVTDERADVLANVEAPGDHRRNKRLIQDALGTTGAPVIVDAVGEGSGVADELAREYDVTRFKGGANAREPQKYYNQRAEALGKLGEWLDDGAIPPGSDVASELRAASRHIEFTEKSTRSSHAWTATSTSDLKQSDRMGRSPDLLDALSLAVWGLSAGSESDAGYGFFSY